MPALGSLVVGAILIVSLAVLQSLRANVLPVGADGDLKPDVTGVQVPPLEVIVETGVSVTAAVADREGVPAELKNRNWYSADYTPTQSGEMGSTARVAFTNGEVPIAASGGLVATAMNGTLQAKERTTVVRIRDIRSGALVTEFKTALYVDTAAFAGPFLFFGGIDTNKAGNGEADIYPGGGLWAIAVRDGTDPVLVVPPEPKLQMGREPFGFGGRAPLKVSSTGFTLASAVYMDGGATGRVDIVDVASLAVRTTLPQYVYTLTDDVAAMRGTSGSSVDLVAIDSGNQIASVSVERRVGDSWEGPYTFLSALASGDTFIFQYMAGQFLVLSSVSTEGQLSELLSQDLSERTAAPLYLESRLSDAETLVLLPEIGVATSIDAAGGKAIAATFDVTTATLVKEAFAIGAP